LAWTINVGVEDKSFAELQWSAMRHEMAGLGDLAFKLEA
jgi:hypothetical protein